MEAEGHYELFVTVAEEMLSWMQKSVRAEYLSRSYPNLFCFSRFYLGLASDRPCICRYTTFYQRLVGVTLQIDFTTGFNIATGLELETLVMCSDGSFDPDKKLGSHGWIISTTDKITLAKVQDQPMVTQIICLHIEQN
jgi:hypothetical protein